MLLLIILIAFAPVFIKWYSSHLFDKRVEEATKRYEESQKIAKKPSVPTFTEALEERVMPEGNAGKELYERLARQEKAIAKVYFGNGLDK
jgi:hypothetical protein